MASRSLALRELQRASLGAQPAGELIAVAAGVAIPTGTAPMSATQKVLDPDRPTQRTPKVKLEKDHHIDTATMAGVAVGADAGAGVDAEAGLATTASLHLVARADLT